MDDDGLGVVRGCATAIIPSIVLWVIIIKLIGSVL